MEIVVANICSCRVMSVLIENTVNLTKQSPTSKNCRKMSSDQRESKKKPSVVRRTKKNMNNQYFRHSLHEVSNGINELNVKDDCKTEQPSDKCRLKRSRSFHVTEDHTPIAHGQRTRAEILKQYVANCFDIDVDNLDANDNITNITYDPTDGSFPLHDAIEEHNIKDIAVYLLRNENINIEQTNNFGQTPLLFAVSFGLVDVVKLLLASGAVVNCKDNYGVSALRYAVEGGDFEMASLLISNGANAAAVQNGF